MQSKDEYDRIKQLTDVDPSKPDELVEKLRSAQEKGAKSHTIGKLPKNGESVVLNGLLYHVEFADYVKGKFTLKLVLRDL